MASDRYILKAFVLFFLVPFLMVGCKSSKTTEEPVRLQQTVSQESQLVSVPEQPLLGPTQESSYELEYNVLYNESLEIHKKYQILAPRAEKFINSYYPNNQIQKHQLMTMSLIASACNYLLDNESNAKFYGTKAFEYKEDKSIAFPERWEGIEWKRLGIDSSTLKKLVAMKDFLRSCSNGGFDAFCRANESFFGKGQFLDAMQDYQNAMRLGLEKEDLRKECYLRLSACYHKAARKDDCEKLFLELLILDPDTNINVGDQETRENLETLKEKYLGEKQ